MLIINNNGTYRYVFPDKTADVQQWLKNRLQNLGLSISLMSAATFLASQLGVSVTQLSDAQLKTTPAVAQQMTTTQPSQNPQDDSIVSDSIMDNKYPPNFIMIMQEHLLPNEGGYVFNKKDHGGETNFGLTKAVYEAWKKRNKEPGETDMRAIPASHLYDIYYQDFWKPVRGDELDYELALYMFDWSINSGPSRPIKHLQRIFGMKETGIFDDALMKKVLESDQKILGKKLSESRLKFINDNVARGGIHPDFQRGLNDRVNKLPVELKKREKGRQERLKNEHKNRYKNR